MTEKERQKIKIYLYKSKIRVLPEIKPGFYLLVRFDRKNATLIFFSKYSYPIYHQKRYEESYVFDNKIVLENITTEGFKKDVLPLLEEATGLKLEEGATNENLLKYKFV